jgi:integrase
VNWQWRGLHIADKIDTEGRAVPLTPYVARLLSGLPRRNEWVFSTTSHTTAPDGSGRKNGWHITEPRIAHVKALTAAGLPHVTLHGLRRSFGTLAEWVEVPVGIVAQIQGHKPSALAEKHYRRRPLDLLRMWHTKIEEWILFQAGIEFKPKKSGLYAVA